MTKFKRNIITAIIAGTMITSSACANAVENETINNTNQFETWYVSADSGLNCRTKPSTEKESSILKVYDRGTELQIIGIDDTGKWWETWDGETQGWCYSTYFVQNKKDLDKTSNSVGGEIGTYLGRFYGTGYTSSPAENGGSTKTAMGDNLSDVIGYAIAADPRVIPMNTKVYIKGIGYRVVRDTGGAIKGNKIDILTNSNSESYAITGYYDVYLAK